MVRAAGITPENLDQQAELGVASENGNTLTVCCCPMNCMVRMNKGSDELKALYNYHLAAKHSAPPDHPNNRGGAMPLP